MPISPRTQEAYLACVRQWAEHFSLAPELISAEQLRQYFIHLKCIKKVARQTSTQVLCAIKLFWEKTLRRVWPAELELVRAQPRFKLPVILSAQEVRLILGCVAALDQRVALITLYSCVLRLSEGLNLQVRDIESGQMFLHFLTVNDNRDRSIPFPL